MFFPPVRVTFIYKKYIFVYIIRFRALFGKKRNSRPRPASFCRAQRRRRAFFASSPRRLFHSRANHCFHSPHMITAQAPCRRHPSHGEGERLFCPLLLIYASTSKNTFAFLRICAFSIPQGAAAVNSHFYHDFPLKYLHFRDFYVTILIKGGAGDGAFAADTAAAAAA